MSSNTPETSVSDPKPSSAETGNLSARPAETDDEGGLMPAMLIGGAILAVVAALIFWPTGEDPTADGGEHAKARTTAGAVDADGRDGNAPGGVQPRSVDDPIPRPPEPRINPAIPLPDGIGPAPGLPEPEVVPTFDNVEDEIAWYEKRLAHAIEQRDRRELFVQRLDRARQKAEQSDNPQRELELFENKKRIVEENLEIAQQKVDEIETKLAELRR